jgi:hypothetical protein
MKSLNLLLITIIIPFIYSCAKESDSPESTKQNASPSSHVKMTTLASESTSCTYGGVKIEMGIDDDMNGTLDASEVDKTEYVCNGAPGATGATGATGAAGTDNKIKYTHYCNALLQNTAFYYRYRVYQFVNEDIFIQGEIYGTSYEVADSIMYSKLQTGWDTAPIYINYDVQSTANFGFFVISLNRSTMVTTIVYTDSDVTGGALTWSQPSSDCTTQTLF